MRKIIALAVVGVVLLGLALLWNTLGAEALPTDYQALVTPVSGDRAPAGKRVNKSVPSSLWSQPWFSAAWIGALPKQPEDTQNGLTDRLALLKATNTPAGPPLSVTNTPAPPDRVGGPALDRLSSSLILPGPADGEQPETTVEERSAAQDEQKQRALKYARALRQAGAGFHVSGQAEGQTPHTLSTHSTSSETCLDIILNPQMDVVETPDGNYADPWNFPIGVVYFSDSSYASPSYSLYMADETDGSDQNPGGDWDYDQFGQAFQAPANLSRLTIKYNRAYLNANDTDIAWSNIWPLDSDGYLTEEPLAYRIIGAGDGWANRTWELSSSELAEASGKTLVLLFDMLSDRYGPNLALWYDELILLDDAQVTLCYRRGTNTAYLPLVIREPAGSPVPVCKPRKEPDSVYERGTTTLGATCVGYLNQLDKKDYYTLNLNGASKIRVALSQLPEGTNWQAAIWEITSGSFSYLCHIGTPGDSPKSVTCNVNPNKDYFVLVDRGDPSAGYYTLEVVDLSITQPAPKSEATGSPREPDSRYNGGPTTVGATSYGSFNSTDQADYHTSYLDSVSSVRLALSELPEETDWSPWTYGDTSGYPLDCLIGTPGDAPQVCELHLRSRRRPFCPG